MKKLIALIKSLFEAKKELTPEQQFNRLRYQISNATPNNLHRLERKSRKLVQETQNKQWQKDFENLGIRRRRQLYYRKHNQRLSIFTN